MKNILIFILTIVPCFLYSQKREVKNSGEKTEIIFNSTYIVERDTFGDNSVTIKLIPIVEVKKQLESDLAILVSEETNLDKRINELQERKKVVRREIKEIEKLIQNIDNKLKNKNK